MDDKITVSVEFIGRLYEESAKLKAVYAIANSGMYSNDKVEAIESILEINKKAKDDE